MKRLILPLFIILLPITAEGQIDNLKERAIDSIFLEWNSPNSPGGAIGIAIDGNLVYSKAFGLASLEYLVPNNTGTRFNIASVSKEFTAMGIVKLCLEGKLSIDDDVRKYIPELPDFGYTVTLRHMLHHTSGMRSLHLMLEIAGWRGDDTRTNDDLLRFITKQRDLNFIPGDEYMYCNTGYILMGMIIERLTGQDFPSWMRENIFLPLGMYNTYVEDKYNRIVPDNATSYNGSAQNGFERAVEYWGYTGSGNIHSTTGDMLKWFACFHSPPGGWGDAFKMMQTTDTLNNGNPNNYAFGVIVDKYRGMDRISHSGSIGGFRSFGCTFPESRTEIVLLTNFSSSDVTGKSAAVVNILYDMPGLERSGQGSRPARDTTEYIPDSKYLEGIAGDYWSPELETQYSFSVKDGQLTGYHNRHGEFSTKAIGKDRFTSNSGFISRITIVRDKRGKVTGMKVSNSRVRDLWLEKR